MATVDNAYPFAGIVGMADLKLALLLNAVSPAIGGVLVRGEKGTAKSTMVRGLAELLPPVPVVPGCPYSCDPAAPEPLCPAGPHENESLELRPVTLKIGFGLLELSPHRAVIESEEDVPLLDILAFLEMDLRNLPIDPRFDHHRCD